MEQLETTTKIPPKGTPEHREYFRQAKRKSRDKKKQETVDYDLYLDSFWESRDYDRIKDFIDEESDKIASELGAPVLGSEECIAQVLSLHFGFQERIFVHISKPSGLLVGWLFPDAVGDFIVSWTHKHNLERSPTYSKIYRSLLETLDRRFGSNSEKSDVVLKSCADAIKQELAS